MFGICWLISSGVGAFAIVALSTSINRVAARLEGADSNQTPGIANRLSKGRSRLMKNLLFNKAGIYALDPSIQMSIDRARFWMVFTIIAFSISAVCMIGLAIVIR